MLYVVSCTQSRILLEKSQTNCQRRGESMRGSHTCTQSRILLEKSDEVKDGSGTGDGESEGADGGAGKAREERIRQVRKYRSE